ncbi:hypothetical protein REPUB_Repub09cG0055200 [Reevesia pubescens]
MDNKEKLNMDWCPFWVQIHGLPSGIMSENVGMVLGEFVGDVEEVDIRGEQMAWGRFLRIKVNINTTKPLKMGTRVSSSDGKKVLTMFRYEKLANFLLLLWKT